MAELSNKEVQERMKKLMAPVDEAILHCDNAEDVLMLSSIMLTTAMGIFRKTLGEDGARVLVQEMLDQ